jgi:uncharacterized protein
LSHAQRASQVMIPSVPLPFAWAALPRQWELAPNGVFTIDADARTDLFINPDGESPAVLNAARLTSGPIVGDFILHARVTVDFAATYDAGVLLIWADEANWAKLCFEVSPRGEPTIVSVVTRGLSDDCNSAVVNGSTAWLRISRIGRAYAFHSSADGESWQLVRHFALPSSAPVSIGFEAQSPVGDGCSVTFDRITLESRSLGDIRSGE